MEDNLKMSKGEYLNNHCMDRDLCFHLRGKLRGNLECGSAQPSLLFVYRKRLTVVTVATFNTQKVATVATFNTQRVDTVATFNTQKVATVATFNTQKVDTVATFNTQKVATVATFNTQKVATVATFITQKVATHMVISQVGPPLLYICSSVPVAQPVAPMQRGEQGGGE
jgi:hypothetical protein